jgi:hypothetical protein
MDVEISKHVKYMAEDERNPRYGAFGPRSM